MTAFVALTLLGQLGCRLLLWLSHFGQSPFDQLPLTMIVMWGVLLAGALRPLSRTWGPLPLGMATALAVAANLVLFVPFAGSATAFAYLAAPLAMVAVNLCLSFLPVRTGDMVSAMSIYVVATVLANYTLDSFIPIGDFLLVNVGTFFFGITFTQRDRVHRFGRPAVYTMIAVAAIANVAVSVGLGTPLRYVAVAFLAIIVSETVDTEIYARLLRRRWLVRVATSNAVSAPLDTIIFTTLAFWGEPFATPFWMFQVIVTDIIVKYGSGIVAALPGVRMPGRTTARPLPEVP